MLFTHEVVYDEVTLEQFEQIYFSSEFKQAVDRHLNARRELLEEIGGTARKLRLVGQFYTSNGISNEVAYVYLATGVELGEAQPEPTELMEMRLVPLEEAHRPRGPCRHLHC